MKTLKITLVAICSIVLLTGVSALNKTIPNKGNTNKEVKTPEVKLLVLTEIKGKKKPTNG
ncbi:hypothetical protein [Psychroserpens sp. NJDZ02]|uniref:hypothetical protein n=1 Tax=Psychroserpens sp. NJDZ02 TaxID=2570561 RepID=UPI0010A8A475|nr:hypothetical protein [Psychroserpens sp. NJDZ02]QCE41499.1 hypothetical protein E9099_08735 [Psychroserpens sp. NJDZ02]